MPQPVRLKKSPLNVLVGNLLQHLQQEIGLPDEAVATNLGVSRSYLRPIQLGTRSLPAYAAPGLTKLGIEFENASALVSIIHYLDLRDSEGVFYDLEKIATRADDLTRLVPHLDQILTWLVNAIASLGLGEEIDSSSRPLLERFSNILRTRPKTSGDSPTSVPESPHQSYELSPIFGELVNGLVNQLALFLPSTNVNSIADWEKTNARRIKGVKAYVEDVDKLLGSAEDFDWAFLSNEHQPIVRIYLPPSAQRVPGIERDLRGKLRRKTAKRSGQADYSENVVVKAISTNLVKECDHNLWFDFVTRGPVDSQARKKLRERSGAGRRFNNVWLYEIRPDALQPAQSPHLIGFLGTHGQGDPEGVYGVAMQASHTQLWSAIFDKAER